MANYTSYDRAPWWTERNYIKSVLISDGVTKIGNFAFNGCIVMNAVTIEDSVTAIGYNAFGSCWALTSVTLPRSVLTIENDTFAGCSRLTTISVDAANPNYADIDGVLFNKAKTTLILYPGAHGASYTIPNSVKIIGDSAFEYSSIVSVIIPDSVKEIGVSAFQDCYSLSSVVIGSKVANIADYAFYGCYAIKTIVIMATAWNTGLG